MANIEIKEMEKLNFDLTNKAILVYPELEDLVVKPTTESQSFISQRGYAYRRVDVEAVDNTIDENIIANNIRENVEILGVEGTLIEYEPPELVGNTLVFKQKANVNEGVLEL